MKQIILISFLIICLVPAASYSQTRVEKGFELSELIKIAEMYKNTPNLSFDFNYTYSDSIDFSCALETITGSSKISDGRYYTLLDSVEFIQGYQYNLSVFHKDSAVVVSNKQEYAEMMRIVPVLDSIFNSEFVDSLAILATDDMPINTLVVHFSADAPYSHYQMVYDRWNFRIHFIQFYARNIQSDEGIASGTALVKVTFSDYSTNPISQDVFWEDKFIYKQAGEIFLKPAYAGYQLLDNTTIKTSLPN